MKKLGTFIVGIVVISCLGALLAIGFTYFSVEHKIDRFLKDMPYGHPNEKPRWDAIIHDLIGESTKFDEKLLDVVRAKASAPNDSKTRSGAIALLGYLEGAISRNQRDFDAKTLLPINHYSFSKELAYKLLDDTGFSQRAQNSLSMSFSKSFDTVVLRGGAFVADDPVACLVLVERAFTETQDFFAGKKRNEVLELLLSGILRDEKASLDMYLMLFKNLAEKEASHNVISAFPHVPNLRTDMDWKECFKNAERISGPPTAVHPDSKVLIITRFSPPEGAYDYEIYVDRMKALPTKNIPSSLSEVNILILVNQWRVTTGQQRMVFINKGGGNAGEAGSRDITEMKESWNVFSLHNGKMVGSIQKESPQQSVKEFLASQFPQR